MLVPHVNSDGPRLLPKIPLLKMDFNAKVLPNPCKISVDGKELMLVNYPLIKYIHSKSLMQSNITQ